jgi:hypothetical protein
MSGPPAPAALAAQLAVLSLISFGGIPSVLPDIHNLVVVTKGWVTDREFADFFAIAQVRCHGSPPTNNAANQYEIGVRLLRDRGFADSSLEEAGFEPSVPRQGTAFFTEGKRALSLTH